MRNIDKKSLENAYHLFENGDIEKIAAKYDAHVDSIINEVINDTKFKDQAEPRTGPTFVDKLKQFFKAL